jgi:DNA-directed RNA polymerase subunit K/omega
MPKRGDVESDIEDDDDGEEELNENVEDAEEDAEEDGEEDIEEEDDDMGGEKKDDIKDEIKINSVNARMSSDFTSYYEKARFIGDRTAHICNGAPIYVDKKQIDIPHLEYMTPIQAAVMEMLTGKMPFILARTHLDGSVDIYKCDELENVLSSEITEKIMKTF